VPLVTNNTANTGNAVISASISNFSQLTGSDYSLAYDGTSYTLTNLTDNKVVSTSPTMPMVADGVTINLATGTPNAGDSFTIRPTANAAANMSVAITDPALIAAAAPLITNAPSTNTGTATISSGVVDNTGSNVLSGATAPAPITFSGAVTNNATFSVDGVPVTLNQDVTVTGNGTGPGTLAASIQAGLTAAGLTSYTVSTAAAGGLQITHAGSLSPVAITNANPVAVNNGIVNGAGTPGPAFTPATVTPPVTLTYSSGPPGTLTGFPAGMPVTVTNNGVPTTFAAGTPVTYTDGATIDFGGVNFSISGTPGNNDTFSIGQNVSGSTDNRNALLLAGLQTQNTMQGGTTNYEGVYSELVTQVGNQTSQLKVTSTAQTTLVNQSIASQQSVSGVNLDEEAANLLRYQQAYQAAGKAMQIASTLFDTLLTIGK
jgi:flagellar hook-associated protein 1 FlgK